MSQQQFLRQTISQYLTGTVEGQSTQRFQEFSLVSIVRNVADQVLVKPRCTPTTDRDLLEHNSKEFIQKGSAEFYMRIGFARAVLSFCFVFLDFEIEKTKI
eukprot:750463-Hanusia_phi.AAC.8